MADDLFKSQAQVWVNPVNCVGVMGAGLAKKFANRFPGVLNYYRHACNVEKSLRPGGIITIPQHDTTPPPTWVVCLATKDHWQNHSQLRWIDAGLLVLAAWCRDEQITSLAIPAIGCGLGGLQWSVIRPLIVDRLGFIPGLEIYEPQ